ncbi:unnamed protein product [Caenorhabditis sp. 36 PRJEB53466]|nr:unnamed protein product [Caenorhabditis sp. 36 PRJEB53466]
MKKPPTKRQNPVETDANPTSEDEEEQIVEATNANPSSRHRPKRHKAAAQVPQSTPSSMKNSRRSTRIAAATSSVPKAEDSSGDEEDVVADDGPTSSCSNRQGGRSTNRRVAGQSRAKDRQEQGNSNGGVEKSSSSTLRNSRPRGATTSAVSKEHTSDDEEDAATKNKRGVTSSRQNRLLPRSTSRRALGQRAEEGDLQQQESSERGVEPCASSTSRNSRRITRSAAISAVSREDKSDEEGDEEGAKDGHATSRSTRRSARVPATPAVYTTGDTSEDEEDGQPTSSSRDKRNSAKSTGRRTVRKRAASEDPDSQDSSQSRGKNTRTPGRPKSARRSSQARVPLRFADLPIEMMDAPLPIRSNESDWSVSDATPMDSGTCSLLDIGEEFREKVNDAGAVGEEDGQPSSSTCRQTTRPKNSRRPSAAPKPVHSNMPRNVFRQNEPRDHMLHRNALRHNELRQNDLRQDELLQDGASNSGIHLDVLFHDELGHHELRDFVLGAKVEEEKSDADNFSEIGAPQSSSTPKNSSPDENRAGSRRSLIDTLANSLSTPVLSRNSSANSTKSTGSMKATMSSTHDHRAPRTNGDPIGLIPHSLRDLCEGDYVSSNASEADSSESREDDIVEANGTVFSMEGDFSGCGLPPVVQTASSQIPHTPVGYNISPKGKAKTRAAPPRSPSPRSSSPSRSPSSSRSPSLQSAQPQNDPQTSAKLPEKRKKKPTTSLQGVKPDGDENDDDDDDESDSDDSILDLNTTDRPRRSCTGPRSYREEVEGDDGIEVQSEEEDEFSLVTPKQKEVAEKRELKRQQKELKRKEKEKIKSAKDREKRKKRIARKEEEARRREEIRQKKAERESKNDTRRSVAETRKDLIYKMRVNKTAAKDKRKLLHQRKQRSAQLLEELARAGRAQKRTQSFRVTRTHTTSEIKTVTRKRASSEPPNMWRGEEFEPIDPLRLAPLDAECVDLLRDEQLKTNQFLLEVYEFCQKKIKDKSQDFHMLKDPFWELRMLRWDHVKAREYIKPGPDFDLSIAKPGDEYQLVEDEWQEPEDSKLEWSDVVQQEPFSAMKYLSDKLHTVSIREVVFDTCPSAFDLPTEERESAIRYMCHKFRLLLLMWKATHQNECYPRVGHYFLFLLEKVFGEKQDIDAPVSFDGAEGREKYLLLRDTLFWLPLHFGDVRREIHAPRNHLTTVARQMFHTLLNDWPLLWSRCPEDELHMLYRLEVASYRLEAALPPIKDWLPHLRPPKTDGWGQLQQLRKAKREEPDIAKIMYPKEPKRPVRRRHRSFSDFKDLPEIRLKETVDEDEVRAMRAEMVGRIYE